MKKTILFLTAAIGLSAASCQKFTKGEGGAEYKIVNDGGAEKVATGDFLAVDMTITSDRNDSLINSTYDFGLPQMVQIAADTVIEGRSYKGDYNSMFRLLGEGDSAVFKLDLDTMAAKTGQPKPPFADKFVTFTVKVKKHFKKGQLTDSVFYAQLDTYFKDETAKLEKAEPAKIEKYVADKKLEPKKTASGLQYVVSQEGKGALPATGDTVVVNYTGKLLSGKVFDTSVKEVAEKEKLNMDPSRQFEPIRISLGQTPVIQGWTEGLALLPKGSKATFIIPSALGYGPQGAQVIPPFAPLVFEVELVDIIKAPAAPATPVAPEAGTTPAVK